MKTHNLLLLFILLIIQVGYAQEKQGNTLAADIFADAPYRMQLTNEAGNTNPIPVYCMVYDGDEIGAAVDLIGIDIYIKNAQDTDFGDKLLFDTLPDTEFESLIFQGSPNDEDLDIQNFYESGYTKSNEYSIDFTAQSTILSDNTFVKINQNIWYFTFLIPAEILSQYDDIVDIKVYFHLDWSSDDETYLRVFRYNESRPQQAGWYRGDTHTHALFTQNIAEIGSAIESTKFAGQHIGLDWQILTDHSCDYDNYGNSMQENWTLLKQQINLLNEEDDSYIFIPGVEMSVTNSDNKVIHALTFPSENSLDSFGLYGDGGGDASSTDVSIDDLLDSVHENDGIVYAAHPFAEGDKLSAAVSGGIWNIGRDDFPLNGEPYYAAGNVICNDTELASDCFSDDPNYFLKPGLYGFQIWNLDTRLVTSDTDNFYDAWNVTGDSGKSELERFELEEDLNLNNRFWQGLHIYRNLLKTGLQAKNANDAIQNWKAYICAGSDAHGSFNYSNTDMIIGVSGDVQINALGRLSTLAYCPDGMGAQGENVLKALAQGNTILSDGPIISFTINDGGNEAIIGSEIIIPEGSLSNSEIQIKMTSSEEYGSIFAPFIWAGNGGLETSTGIPTDNEELTINLESLLDDVFENDIPLNTWFYLRASLQTQKSFGDLSDIYKRTAENYNAYTNPIWIKIESPNAVQTETQANANIRYTADRIICDIDLASKAIKKVSVIATTGQSDLQIDAISSISNQKSKIEIHRSELDSGMYFLMIEHDSGIITKKIIN
ncbi:MAG: T9SS type A sorting domain-containing protein [Bacteroidales bacterium]|jgi:hypothetical protein|nr:T9SS type A sorting domain-containing protein [Bacteroidales bacterium]